MNDARPAGQRHGWALKKNGLGERQGEREIGDRWVSIYRGSTLSSLHCFVSWLTLFFSLRSWPSHHWTLCVQLSTSYPFVCSYFPTFFFSFFFQVFFVSNTTLRKPALVWTHLLFFFGWIDVSKRMDRSLEIKTISATCPDIAYPSLLFGGVKVVLFFMLLSSCTFSFTRVLFESSKQCCVSSIICLLIFWSCYCFLLARHVYPSVLPQWTKGRRNKEGEWIKIRSSRSSGQLKTVSQWQ